MLQGLSDRLGAIFQRLRSRGKLTESDVSEVLREVRIALLEADVNLKVVKDFIASIRERAVGAEVLESLTPAQAVVKIVHDGLVELMGGADRARALRAVRADGHHARRIAGQRQDDARGEARAAFQGARPAPAARRVRRLPAGCDHAVAGAGRADRRSGLRVSRSRPPSRSRPARVDEARRRSATASSSSTPPAGCRSTSRSCANSRTIRDRRPSDRDAARRRLDDRPRGGQRRRRRSTAHRHHRARS